MSRSEQPFVFPVGEAVVQAANAGRFEIGGQLYIVDGFRIDIEQDKLPLDVPAAKARLSGRDTRHKGEWPEPPA
jgi:hypothetical protein